MFAHRNIDRNPHNSRISCAHSNYMGQVGNEVVRLIDGERPSARALEIHQALRSFITDRHPCAGARAVIHAAGHRFGIYHGMSSRGATAGIARDLWTFVQERPSINSDFATFIAIFDPAKNFTEHEFESAVWEQLNALRDIDRSPYSRAVSSDPSNPRFGFSFASTPFFIVGLHPGSSRFARRFAWPALVFNAHSQFDKLVEQGIYDRFRAVVRKRDLTLQGSLNPNLAEFGERSEAREYSGRAVEEDWKCPFRARRRRRHR